MLDKIKNDRYALFSAIVCALLLLLIFYSLIVRIQIFMLGTSLWNDEAMLAESIVSRTMRELLTQPLANTQTAPVLYLVVVKILTILFGTSETVLRVFSFASLIGMLVAQGLLLRKVFHVRISYTLFSVAVSSTFLYYMEYSVEFKPYMGDAAFVLLAFLGYYAYREGRLGNGFRSVIWLAIIFVVCMLFSSPAAFAVGAVIVVEFILKCFRRDKTAIIQIVIVGSIFLLAFVLNYYFWLRSYATDGGMTHFWSGRIFRLSNSVYLIRELLGPIWHSLWLTLPMTIAGFVISLFRRNVYTLTIGVFFILLIIASAIGKYPMIIRLWMFLYVIIFIYCFVFLDSIRFSMKNVKTAKIIQTIIPLFLACFLLLPNLAFTEYGKGASWTISQGGQANPLIEFVGDNIQDGEVFYAFFPASRIVKYKIGYDTARIGDVSDDNIIFGNVDYWNELDVIAQKPAVYILFYHSYYPLSQNPDMKNATEYLMSKGFMERILNVENTYLYWYTNDFSKVKSSARLEISDIKSAQGMLSGVFRIENTGRTILAPGIPEGYVDPNAELVDNGLGKLQIVLSNSDNEIVLRTITSPIAPSESIELLIERGDLTPGEYQIRLVSPGQFNFDTLGVSPIPITISQ